MHGKLPEQATIKEIRQHSTRWCGKTHCTVCVRRLESMKKTNRYSSVTYSYSGKKRSPCPGRKFQSSWSQANSIQQQQQEVKLWQWQNDYHNQLMETLKSVNYMHTQRWSQGAHWLGCYYSGVFFFLFWIAPAAAASTSVLSPVTVTVTASFVSVSKFMALRVYKTIPIKQELDVWFLWTVTWASQSVFFFLSRF